MPNSIAAQKNLKAGDKITKINKELIRGWPFDRVISTLRSSPEKLLISVIPLQPVSNNKPTTPIIPSSSTSVSSSSYASYLPPNCFCHTVEITKVLFFLLLFFFFWLIEKKKKTLISN